MAREPYVYIASAPIGDDVDILGGEATHLATVLRLNRGAQMILFDGTGQRWIAAIVDVHPKAVQARIISPIPFERLLPPQISIAVGVVKGSHMDWAVEKAAETGAFELFPLLAERSVVHPGEGRLERWRNIAISAAKQSRRARLMTIHEPVTMLQLLENLPEKSAVAALHPHRDSLPIALAGNALTEWSQILLLIGPEGGFTEDEVNFLADSGIPCMSLGRHFYRTDTAVAVGVGMFNALKEAKYGV